MTFRLEAAITRKVMKLDDRRQHNGDPCFREQPCTDHQGRKYDSISDMARAYDLPATIVIGRFYRGWDLKTALTAPIGYRRPKTVHTDHEGRTFSTQREMCKAWGISESLYRMRRNHGMTQKQALTAPRGYKHKEVNHGQNATR